MIRVATSPIAGVALKSGGAPLRVLHIIGGLGPGGAEAILYRLIALTGHIDHRVICFGRPDWYSHRLDELGVPVEHLGMTSLGGRLCGLKRLVRLVRRNDADIVQGWMYRANLLGGLVARAAGIPSVWGIHCASLEPLRFSARMFVYACGVAARWIPSYVINCSKGSVPLHDRLGFGRAPGGVIHNGYDADFFHPDADSGAEMRRALGILESEFVIGSVSRWHPEKDVPNLLKALQLFRDRSQASFRCVLVGNLLTPENEELQLEVAARQLEGVVIPLGRRGDVVDILRAIDLHVLPSRSESFPNTVAEAMLSGVPCVVTHAGDAPLMVGDTGWVAPPKDPLSLAACIEEAYREFRDDKSEWETRRSAARARIAKNYTSRRMASEYEAVWRSVAQKRNRS